MAFIPGKHVSVRDRGLVDHLDRIVETTRAARPGRRISREGVARELLHAAVNDEPLMRELGYPPIRRGG